MKRMNIDRVYNATFYQFPKAFITDIKYKNMSDGAKIVYMLLKARSEVAMIRKQYDEKGDIFFTFSNKELAELTNYSERKVTNCKKELMEKDLLEQVQLGLNQKPRLYIGELDVDGVYEKPNPRLSETKNSQTFIGQSVGAQGVAKSATPEKGCSSSENVDLSMFCHDGISQSFSQSVGTQGVAKSATNIINNNIQSDTNTDTLIDTSKDQFMQSYSKTFLSKELLSEIYVFKQNLTDASELINRIYQAKRQVEKESRMFTQNRCHIAGENYQEALLQTFRRFVGQDKIRRATEKNVINQRLGYWYKTCVTFWQACLRWENVEGVENFMYGEHTPNPVEIADLEIKVKEAQMSLDNHEFMSWLHGRQQKVSEISLFDYVNEG